MNRPRRTSERADAVIDRFTTFWSTYPKKVGKGAALKAWTSLRPDEALLRVMVAALEWQCQSDQWLRDGGRFIPNPSTWLNQSRWTDEPTRTPRLNDRTVALARATREFLKS